MNFQIKFIAGECIGECYIIDKNQALSIGRSHSNNVCLKSPDISGRHCIVRAGSASNITLEILSSRVSKHNDRLLNIGDVAEIAVGDRIQMGNDTVFVLEYADLKTVIAADDDDKTVLPELNAENSDAERTVADNITAVNASETKNAEAVPSAAQTVLYSDDSENDDGESFETVAFQTRIASDEELDEIKKSFKRQHFKKVVMIALPILLFLAGAITVYLHLKPETEEFLTWPTDEKGTMLEEFKVVAPYLAVCYPAVDGAEVQSKGNTVTLVTRIGKLQDVPLYIQATTENDLKTLKVEHNRAFDMWCEKMKEKDPSISFGADKVMYFLNRSYGGGVPMSFVSYTRRKGSDDFWGYALFIRNAQNIHTIFLEVPFADRWRAKKFLPYQLPGMVIYAVRRTAEHWEGNESFRADSSVKDDLEEAEEFMKREAPVYWGRIFYLIRSALIKATVSNNADDIAAAKKLLVKLREQQSSWYNTQKLAYQYAERNGDKNAMNSIQTMCESVFSAEFQSADFRYDLIKRKDWK